MTPTLYWIRRDFRLADNPALTAAVEIGGAVLPVFICDGHIDDLPIAPKWRLGLGLEKLGETYESLGSRIILRRGEALDTLQALIAETGAKAVHWNRLYDPDAIARDTKVKEALKEQGVEVHSHNGHLINEPWTVQTGGGSFYKVYTPFWKAVRERDVTAPLPSPSTLNAPETWPASDRLADWQLGKKMRRGAEVVRPYITLGEEAALQRLDGFIPAKIGNYAEARDMLAQDGTSGLSENLAYGEISPRTLWHKGQQEMALGAPGAETFLKEVIWRDFAYHLMYHTPHITTQNWKPEWDAFPWAEDGEKLTAWQRGRTGMAVVDAGMREMYVTGRMHNRARMLVASYLTKHLLTHWRAGQAWFADHLVDWDPASNAMGWQWAAGSGPDAAPYFRVFNPETQAEKFDPHGRYRRKWVAELSSKPCDEALSYFDAIPRHWDLSPTRAYPAAPIVPAKDGREIALNAYQNRSWAV